MRTLKIKLVLFVLPLLFLPRCRAQVYAQGSYSVGDSYWSLSSTTLPFAPYKYGLTEVTWREDTNGVTLGIDRETEPGAITKRSLEIECGSETFTILLDSFASRSMKSSGNLAQLLTQCVTNRGGHMTTNTLSVFQATWIRQPRPNGDIIVIDGDRFTGIQKLLEQTYGKPDAGVISTDLNVNGRSLTYSPTQIGVMLNLTFGVDQTVVSIIGKHGP